jgi:hypothetical protein
MDDRQVSNIIKLEKKFTALWLARWTDLLFTCVKKKGYRLPSARLAFAFLPFPAPLVVGNCGVFQLSSCCRFCGVLFFSSSLWERL